MVKDTVEKPDEEKHGVRSGRCQVQELLCHGIGVYHSPGVDVFTNSEAL